MAAMKKLFENLVRLGIINGNFTGKVILHINEKSIEEYEAHLKKKVKRESQPAAATR